MAFFLTPKNPRPPTPINKTKQKKTNSWIFNTGVKQTPFFIATKIPMKHSHSIHFRMLPSTQDVSRELVKKEKKNHHAK